MVRDLTELYIDLFHNSLTSDLLGLPLSVSTVFIIFLIGSDAFSIN